MIKILFTIDGKELEYSYIPVSKEVDKAYLDDFIANYYKLESEKSGK